MLRDALDRTLLLMRDEISQHVTDDVLLAALTETSVALVADEKNLTSHSAQSAYVTAAMLLARSGHRVYLTAPNVALLGNQPPLASGKILDQLDKAGQNLLPGVSFSVDNAPPAVDLAILFGDTPWTGQAIRAVRLNATSWQAQIMPVESGKIWSAKNWPIGGMGAAALGAAEAFKIAMRRAGFAARDWSYFAELVAPTTGGYIDLAPRGMSEISSLDQIDFISGGAITNCALYALLRLPDLSGAARIIEHDIATVSNLNRGMLFLLTDLKEPKAEILSQYAQRNFPIVPVVSRYEPAAHHKIGPLSNTVLVGVDDIPTRWEVQRTWPNWLGIGATTHFSAMASFHTPDLPCAGCLHHVDDLERGQIPTVAFVSFWAGLWLATLYLRHLSGHKSLKLDQQIYFSPLRPETIWTSPVQRRSDCPVGCGTKPLAFDKAASVARISAAKSGIIELAS